MMHLASRPLRTLVCGTRFGEMYISALTRRPGIPPFHLCGILARGSERSRTLAQDLDVPLYTDVADLPDNIDVACVALRSSAFGGPGIKVATALLRRGIHVVYEHPLHPSEVRVLDAAARESKAFWVLNTFYPDTRAAERMSRYVQTWHAQRKPDYITVTTSPQFLLSSLDILQRCFGSLDTFHIFDRPPWPEPFSQQNIPPFEVIRASLDGIPTIIHLQGWIDPRDADHHALVMHNIAVGGREGRLELVNSFGPLVWTRPIYVPDYAQDTADASLLRTWDLKAEQIDFKHPMSVVFGPSEGMSFLQAIETEFPIIIAAALSRLKTALEMNTAEKLSAQALSVSTAWHTCMQALGPLRSVALSPPPLPIPEPCHFAHTCSEEGVL